MMIEVTVKTLDSRNHPFSVEDNIIVKEFKEKIASTVNVPASSQRLIYCGRVLQDDKKISDYDVHGKVIHLVQRAPTFGPDAHNSSSQPTSHSSPFRRTGRTNPNPNTPGSADGNSFLLGAFTIPQDSFDANNFQQIIQNVISDLGDIGRNATVMSRTSEDGSSVDVHINLGHVPSQSEAQQRIMHANRLLGYINRALDDLERGNIENSAIPAFESTFEIGTDNDNFPIAPYEAAASAAAVAAATANAFSRLGVPVQPAPIIIQASSQSMENILNGGTRVRRNAGTQSSNSTPPRPPASTPRSEPVNPTTTPNNGARFVQYLGSLIGNATASPSTTTTTTTPSNASNGTNTTTNNTANPVQLSEFLNLLRQVRRTHERYQPHLSRFEDLLRDDGVLTEQQINEAQRMHRLVSRIMHHMSHVYHLMSDLQVNFSQSPPRNVQIFSSPSLRNQFIPENIRTNNSDTTTRNGSRATSTASSQPHSELATAGSTTASTNSVPRFSQSTLMNQGAHVNSVWSVQSSPIVFMEVGSTIEIPSSTPSTQNNTENPSSSSQPSAEQQDAQPQRGNQPPQGITIGGGSRFGTPFSSLFDPYLPCHSRWTIPEISVRGRIGIGISPTNQGPHNPSSQSSNQATTQTSNSQNNRSSNAPNDPQPFNIGNQIAQIVQTLIGNVGQLGNVGQATAPQQSNERQSTTQNMTPRSEFSVRVDPELLNIFNTLPNNQSDQSQTESANQQPNPIDIIESLTQEMFGQSGRPPAPMSEVLSRLPTAVTYTENESILNDLFMCLARELTFPDFSQVMLGNHVILNRVRDQLSQVVRTIILNNEEPTEENINRAVGNIIEQWNEGLITASNGLNFISDINFLETVKNFLQIKLRSLVNLLANPPSDDTYSLQLYNSVCEMAVEFFKLCVTCFTDGVSSLETMITSFIRQYAGEYHPQIQQWVLTTSLTQARRLIENSNSAQYEISRYIIRNGSQNLTDPTTNDSNVTEEKEDSMETESEFLDAQSTFVQKEDEKPDIVIDKENGDRTPNDSQIQDVVLGSESWHSAVPNDWVPIITRDIQKQRRQGLQRPFSDGYLSSLPKKKRKTNNSQGLNLMQNTSTLLPNVLQRAISISDVRPNSSSTVEEICQGASNDPSLVSGLDEEIKNVVNERINSDEDYDPQRFCLTNNYLNS